MYSKASIPDTRLLEFTLTGLPEEYSFVVDAVNENPEHSVDKMIMMMPNMHANNLARAALCESSSAVSKGQTSAMLGSYDGWQGQD